MRRITLVGLGSIAVLALMCGEANAQRMVERAPGAGYPAPGAMPPAPPPMMARPEPMPGRPAPMISGSQQGVADAPGGYAAYRRPYRGGALPPYWIAPRFTVADWSSYGLSRPGPGYRWTRYYDDAVLVDRHGSVLDSRGGIDWNRQGGRYQGSGYDGGRDAMGDGDGYASRGSMYNDRGADYPSPMSRDYSERGSRYVSPDGATVITTTSGDMTPGYYSDGYGGGVTTVTVRGAPSVTTTTTTETYNDRVTYGRGRPHRVYRSKRLYRHRAN